MKATVNRPTEIEIAFVRIIAPVKYGEDDMPNDFPFRTGDTWTIVVNIDTGQIVDWPGEIEHSLHMKVTDSGCYQLLDSELHVIEELEDDYVPHGVVPGEWGDYICLEIRHDGVITNWPAEPDVSQFFACEDD